MRRFIPGVVFVVGAFVVATGLSGASLAFADDPPAARTETSKAPSLDAETEHRTREGKLYVAAIKDVFSNRIVGWAIDERMKARLVVAAIKMAAARRGLR